MILCFSKDGRELTKHWQYRDLCDRFSSVQNEPKASDVDDELEQCLDAPPNSVDLVTTISGRNSSRGPVVQAAQAAVENLQNHLLAGYDDGVRIWKGPSADQPELLPPINENQEGSGHALERDFTTAGMPSKLGCPFASMAGKQLSSHAASVVSRYRSSAASKSSVSRFTPQGRRSWRPSIEDPIRADVCEMDNLAEPNSPASAGICPIRFLDQHKPEEIAQYFEKHKHELPRSHELCVKRYQSNTESIRQLDAKYGNLESMIQGLGMKHRSMLPHTPPQEEFAAEDKESVAKIQKWARTVSADLEKSLVKEDGESDGEGRQPHFDRPLKDIRVGESPSRPWGIKVPPKFEESASITSSKPAEIANVTDSDKEIKTEADKNDVAQCPFQGPSDKAPSAKQHTTSTPKVADQDRLGGDKTGPQPLPFKADGASSVQPQMLFTGPVFIGYPMDQALAMLQQAQQKT